MGEHKEVRLRNLQVGDLGRWRSGMSLWDVTLSEERVESSVDGLLLKGFGWVVGEAARPCSLFVLSSDPAYAVRWAGRMQTIRRAA